MRLSVYVCASIFPKEDREFGLFIRRGRGEVEASPAPLGVTSEGLERFKIPALM